MLWPVMMIVLLGANVAFFFATSRGPLPIAMGALFAIAAVLYTVRPLIVVDERTVQTKSLLGYTVNRIGHGSFTAIEVEDGALVFGSEGNRQRLRLGRWMVNRKDLDRLAAAVREARADAGATA